MSKCIPCQAATRALKKTSNIIEAYSNLIIKDEEVEKLSKERMKICLSCNNKTVILSIGNNTYYACKFCNCPIDAKTRSKDEVCPIKLW